MSRRLTRAEEWVQPSFLLDLEYAGSHFRDQGNRRNVEPKTYSLPFIQVTMDRREFLVGLNVLGAVALSDALPADESARAGVVLKISLPSDRTRLGQLRVENDAGKLLAGPFRVLGKADGKTAKKYKNDTRAPLLPYGDTPLGGYAVTGGFKVGDGTGYNKRSYGVYGALRLDPSSGDAKLAKDIGGRTGLLIHGGEPGAAGRLRPTNGCLRLSNADMKTLIDELVIAAVLNNVITASCTVASVTVQISDPHAAPDDGYDEGDPPPTTVAPKLP